MATPQLDTPFSELNSAAFVRALVDLRRAVQARLGAADLRHLRRIQGWGRVCTLAGYALAPWLLFNPLAALLISQGNLTRWLLMHHIGHRGYDKVPGVPRRYTSAAFATGWRRFADWFDWMLPEAWNHEHNVLHHYYTGEGGDPDLVEDIVTHSALHRGPMLLRYGMVAFFALTWKWSYYAPNTFRTLHNVQRRKAGEPEIKSWWVYFNPFWRPGFTFWRRCLLPYGLTRFVALPALFLPLGTHAALCVLTNSVLAELLVNLHTFMNIAPNHAGDDVYRFDSPVKDKAEHYMRQITGSVNYRCGNDALDFAQMWLNYQIEHHIWPDLPMLQYRLVQPQVRQLCEDFGLPYVQESIFRRNRKLVEIMVGHTRMRRVNRLSAVVRSAG